MESYSHVKALRKELSGTTEAFICGRCQPSDNSGVRSFSYGLIRKSHGVSRGEQAAIRHHTQNSCATRDTRTREKLLP
jgi:hypothetical protein